MASIAAELHINGRVYTLLHVSYATFQDTDARGRATSRKRFAPTVLVLPVPDDDALMVWAAHPTRRYAVDLVFRDSRGGQALETLHYAAAYCVGYAENFRPGADGQVAYLLTLTLTSPEGWTWRPGGPTNPAYLEPIVITPPKPTPPAEPVEGPPAEPSAPRLPPLPVPGLLGTLGLTALLAVVPAHPAQAPGRPASADAARLAQLESLREERALTPDEEEELIYLLGKVRGSFLFKPAELATYYGDEDEARLALLTPRRWLSHFDLEQTLDHVEYRDYSVPRRKGIGGAHNALEWAEHQADYKEISRIPHPTVPGIKVVEYQIHALDAKGKPTGGLVAEPFNKTIYDPKIWPRPRLRRALQEALQDAHRKNGGTLPQRYWEGVTAQGDSICGYHQNNQITTFFFK